MVDAGHISPYERQEIKFTDRLADAVKTALKEQGAAGAIDTDSLGFKTILHAAVHYIPQDLAVVGAMALWTNRCQRRLNPKYVWPDANAVVDRFMSEHGLEKREMKIRRRRGIIHLNF